MPGNYIKQAYITGSLKGVMLGLIWGFIRKSCYKTNVTPFAYVSILFNTFFVI